jgi:hypothetical protein
VTLMQFYFLGFYYVFYFKQQVFFQVQFCQQRHNSDKLHSIVCWGPKFSIQRSLIFKISFLLSSNSGAIVSSVFEELWSGIFHFSGDRNIFSEEPFHFPCAKFLRCNSSRVLIIIISFAWLFSILLFPPFNPLTPLFYIRAFLSSPHIFIFMLN